MIDIVGDIHGQLDALEALLRGLGHDDGAHGEGRRLLFVGDLVDRGPASLEVALRVRRLCEEAGALCLMGNHEFNLVEWWRGRAEVRPSNRSTIADFETRRGAWEPTLRWLETLPLAVELDDLRVAHTGWHQECVEALEALREPVGTAAPWWGPRVKLHSPYVDGAWRPGLSHEPLEGQRRSPLEIFLKGYEKRAAKPFVDNDGKTRERIRVDWWNDPEAPVPTDRRLVFGHYWNIPPVEGAHEAFAPPHPSGHPRLRAWFEASHEAVPSDGRARVPETVDAVCVDYSGVTKLGSRACVGAYRYPEGEVVWASR